MTHTCMHRAYHAWAECGNYPNFFDLQACKSTRVLKIYLHESHPPGSRGSCSSTDGPIEAPTKRDYRVLIMGASRVIITDYTTNHSHNHHVHFNFELYNTYIETYCLGRVLSMVTLLPVCLMVSFVPDVDYNRFSHCCGHINEVSGTEREKST